MVARLDLPAGEDPDRFATELSKAVEALAGRPGHVRTSVAESLEEPSRWVLVSEWADVGSYRRALSSYDVRMASGVLLASVANEPSAYEIRLHHASEGQSGI